MKNILLTSLLLATSNTYSHDIDCDIIELDDFQETSQSCLLHNQNDNENINEVLKKHWEENTYCLNENQPISNKLN